MLTTVITTLGSFQPPFSQSLHGVASRIACSPRCSADTEPIDVQFSSLLREEEYSAAVALLKESTFTPPPSQVSNLIDAVCANAGDNTISEGVDAIASNQRERELQDQLLNTYEALKGAGALRGFGTASRRDALPAPSPRILLPDDQLRLTGLPTSAFAPPRGNGNGALIAGVACASLIGVLSDQLQVDYRVLGAAFGGGLLLDRALLRGSLFELGARALRPGYARVVRQHEAGHFLVAYLLGMPVQAVLLDAWSALRDGRFAGAAGTVFYDPLLGNAMETGTLTREIIDRYSIVVMAGIAAEAMRHGKAEGGQADEAALIQLLGSLDGGASWDIPRIQNQARWAASQALLLLREHEAVYEALCESLEKGGRVGDCVVAIETALQSSFGRNGELPTETRLRLAETERRRVNSEDAVPTSQTEPPSVEDLAARQKEVAAKLADVGNRLKELDSR